MNACLGGQAGGVQATNASDILAQRDQPDAGEKSAYGN